MRAESRYDGEIRGPRALVVESRDDRGALAACRALHAAGWQVGVTTPTRDSVCSLSRSVRWRHHVAPPTDGLERFINHLRRVVQDNHYDVVLPGWGDAETMALSLGRERIPAAVPLAPHPALLGALNKLELSAICDRVGVPYPLTRPSAEMRDLELPLMVKSRSHATRYGAKLAEQIDVALATTFEEAEQCAQGIERAGCEAIVQERISGQLLELTLLLDQEGRPLARVQQTASRVWPMRGGPSVRAVTEAVDERLAASALRLLGELGWSGLVEIQYLVCPHRGPVLIDLNPRCYGSMELALRAGVNLPALWADSALGRSRTGPPLDGVPGTSYQWIEGDLRYVLALEPGERLPSLVGWLVEIVRADAHAFLRISDPLPFLRQTIRPIARASLRWLRGIHRRISPARGRA